MNHRTNITTRVAACALAIALTAAPASATILTLPFIGDIEHPDFDPLHIMAAAQAEAAPAPAPAPMKKKHRMKKKMMKTM